MSKKSETLGGSAAFDTFVAGSPVSDRGRAIATLTGDPVPVETPTTPKALLEQIAHNPYNPRLTLKAIQNMADSIEQVEQGLIAPITVVSRAAFIAVHPEAEDKVDATALYVAIDGNRRLAGARMAGLETLPIHVDDELARDRDELLKAALIADAQHEDLDHLDQARALAQLVEVHGSQRNVARALGKSQGWVSQRLALLSLSEDLQQQLSAGELTVEIARKVAKLPVEEQAAAVTAELAARVAPAEAATIIAPRQEEEPATSSAPSPPAPAAVREAAKGRPDAPNSQPATETGTQEKTQPEAPQAESLAGADEPSAWTTWLGTAEVSQIAADLAATLSSERLYDLVHTLADHLRASEK